MKEKDLNAHLFGPGPKRILALDGGVSPHNNPALQLLMLATLKGHGLCWPTGADQLLLVSLGTGSKTLALNPSAVMDMKAAELGVRGQAAADLPALRRPVRRCLAQGQAEPLAARVNCRDGPPREHGQAGGNRQGRRGSDRGHTLWPGLRHRIARGRLIRRS